VGVRRGLGEHTTFIFSVEMEAKQGISKKQLIDKQALLAV
jgi:hypothetical protein